MELSEPSQSPGNGKANLKNVHMWTVSQSSVLIEIYREEYVGITTEKKSLSRLVWQRMTDKLNSLLALTLTLEQVRTKIEHLKKQYKTLRIKMLSFPGSARPGWVHFEQLHSFLGDKNYEAATAGGGSGERGGEGRGGEEGEEEDETERVGGEEGHRMRRLQEGVGLGVGNEGEANGSSSEDELGEGEGGTPSTCNVHDELEAIGRADSKEGSTPVDGKRGRKRRRVMSSEKVEIAEIVEKSMKNMYALVAGMEKQRLDVMKSMEQSRMETLEKMEKQMLEFVERLFHQRHS